MTGRPPAVEPYLRGVAWPAGPGVPYPRADPADVDRLPADTWAAATVPVGVRLELVGDASSLDVNYRTATDDLGPGGEGGRTTFSVWRDGKPVDEQRAALGEGYARLLLGSGHGRAVVHLPEGMRPTVTAIEGVGGAIAPAPPQPRWLAYGDSIVAGWLASSPASAWPAIAGRHRAFDVVNLGYAGAARGEVVTAEQLAGLDADVISISYGSDCWTRIPHSIDTMRAGTEAFLRIVRAGHPGVPVVLTSPIVRPDAESAPNVLGATLADLREVVEEVGRFVAQTDPLLTLVPGGELLDPALLPDGVHPGDEGHRVLGGVLGEAVTRAFEGAQGT
jgi:hypothetical protein